MLKKILKKRNDLSVIYTKHLRKPIKESAFLLEAGQGKNINGNMFALAKELCVNPRWKNFKVYWVITDDTKESAKKRFETYGYSIEFINRTSDQYAQLLACVKYLATDNSFPPYFSKRSEQVLLNTWHGTPLKTLGKSDIKNAKSLANIQKNYLMTDYALFPNELTKEVFMKDYMLERLYQGKIVMGDYPRNSALLNTEIHSQIRKELNLENKQVIAYMPTWRGSDRTADAQIQKKILTKYFDELDFLLEEDQFFYVNLHFLVGNIIDFSNYVHIRPFPSEYETYEFLGMCDCLVTDYSSVFFDYAVTEKKIVLFAYDLEDYMRDRGTYFSIYDLPFPIVQNVKDLAKELQSKRSPDLQAFLKTYCNYRNIQAPRDLISLMVNQEKGALCVQKNEKKTNHLVMIYVGELKGVSQNRYLAECIKECCVKYPNKEIVVCFRGKINDKKIEFLNSLPENVHFLGLVTKFNFTLTQTILNALGLHSKWIHACIYHKMQGIYADERNRLFPTIHPEIFINLSNRPNYIYEVLIGFQAHKIAYLQPKNFYGNVSSSKKYRLMISNFKKYYDEIIDRQDIETYSFCEEKESYYNRRFNLANIIRRFKNKKDYMSALGIAVLKTNLDFPLKEVKVEIAGKRYPAKMRTLLRIGKITRIVKYKVMIPGKDIREFEIQNKISFVYEDSLGYGFKKGVKYNLFNWKEGKNKQGPIRIFEDENTSAYFRQSKNNVLYLTVRKRNLTDSRKEQIKLNFAYWIAKFYRSSNIVLLYEKESSRYEESASVLYEKLIDLGYKNAYFILNKDYPYIDSIKEKYKKNVIYKGSFKHYLYFFKAKTFLGSEALVHVIDLRISNKHALDKINSKNINYVFLQHGVMYMVSLDSESRKFFKPMKTNGIYRVVTSSKAEATHFIQLGGYDPSFIYVCGLPKFDRNTWNEDADKIAIMPTWRPWEYNEARYDFQETKYYQMICRIFYAIPEELREKIVILPHPLFYDAVKDSDFDLKHYLNIDEKYDDILKSTKVLITDYSSIAYDAFYRGCNVVFYWEEKDECMENYGPSTKLMLNEENAYGDICYCAKDLTKVISMNYNEKQTHEYQHKYSKLVDYHDGRNTERLIQLLRKDGILK